jgi:hypothetical protein
MIKRIDEGFEDGDIIEFNKVSEPLYLYTDGLLYKIAPWEYNELIRVSKEKRGEKFLELKTTDRFFGR